MHLKTALNYFVMWIIGLCLAACGPSVQEDNPPPATSGADSGYSSSTSSIGALLENPATKAVLDEHAPDISNSSRISLMKSSTLKGIQGYAASVLTDEVLAAIDAELAKITPNNSVENSDIISVVNVDEAKVGPYTLPDPLVLDNGQRVSDADTWWTKRRPEIFAHFETQVYGKVPAEATGGAVEILDSGTPVFNGTALRKQIKIGLAPVSGSRALHADIPTIHVVEYIPTSTKKPAPMFLLLGFTAPSATFNDPGIVETTVWDPYTKQKVAATKMPGGPEFPLEKYLRAGIGVATYYYGDVDPDFPEGFELGIRGIYNEGNPEERRPDSWGSIAAWAWSTSVVQDYLETDPLVDNKRVAIFGASRLGKTALWAAAGDQRFASVIACCAGKLGAGLMRRNFGESIAGANAGSAKHWVADNLTDFYGKEDQLSVDGHMLLGLIAPRPVLLQTGKLDHAADPKGSFLSAEAASPVFELLGVQGLDSGEWPPKKPILSNLGYYIHEGGHGLATDSWDVYLAFLEKHLLNNTSSD